MGMARGTLLEVTRTGRGKKRCATVQSLFIYRRRHTGDVVLLVAEAEGEIIRSR